MIWTNDYRKKRKKNNSVWTMVRILERNPFITENKLNLLAFGYDRNNSWESNKKYADMLRRGLTKGLIKRTEAHPKHKHGNTKYFYYV
jgi:hypothetical protein